MLGVAADTAEPFRPRDGHCRHIGVTHMTTKKPTALLALVGACALSRREVAFMGYWRIGTSEGN